MLEAAGYPDKKGSLAHVANHIGVPAMTISRWFKNQNNPPPNELVSEKRGDLLERLDDLAHKLLDAIMADINENGLDAVRGATALGITIDKHQLLSGGPTETSEQRIIIRREGLSTVPEHLTSGPIGSSIEPETVQRPGLRA